MRRLTSRALGALASGLEVVGAALFALGDWLGASPRCASCWHEFPASELSDVEGVGRCCSDCRELVAPVLPLSSRRGSR